MVKNRWGRNALHEACSVWSGPPDTVELLLLANMCPDIQVCESPFYFLLIFSSHAQRAYFVLVDGIIVVKAQIGKRLWDYIKSAQMCDYPDNLVTFAHKFSPGLYDEHTIDSCHSQWTWGNCATAS